MEAGAHGNHGESVQEHVVEECNILCENVIAQFQRMEESIVKASVCSTDPVILKIVQRIVSFTLFYKCNYKIKHESSKPDQCLCNLQAKHSGRNNVRLTMIFPNLLELALQWNGYLNLLESLPKTDASWFALPKALDIFLFFNQRWVQVHISYIKHICVY